MFKRNMFLLFFLGLTFFLAGCVKGPDGDAYLAVDWDYFVDIYYTSGSLWDAYDPPRTSILKGYYYRVKKGKYYGYYEAFSGANWYEWYYDIKITVRSGEYGFITPGAKGEDSEFYLYLSWDDGPYFEQERGLSAEKSLKDLKEGMETYSKKTIGDYTIEVKGKLIKVGKK